MTLFNENANAETPVVDENKDYLTELVGEDKKFKDTQALARGKAESDLFIARLQNELAGLREDLNQRARLSELVDKLQPKTPDNANQGQEPTRHEEQNTAFDPAKLEETVGKLLRQQQEKSAADRNIETVKKTLTDTFGPGYADKLKAKAAELGVSPDWMTSVASQSPNAFFNLIGLNKQPANPGFTPPAGTRQTSFEPANPNRDKSYYDKLKATNPSAYWSPATQNQMHNDALKLGEKFFV